MKRCVIVNPKAGSVKDVEGLLKRLERLGSASIHVTSARGEAEKFARESSCEEIIAAGGDGTLNEVVNGVAGRMDQVRVGLIPLGTGNDFARCLKLPQNVEENIDIVLSGETSALDVVRAKSDYARYFLNVSAGGFSASASRLA